MPAASAEKKARQRANKLLRKEAEATTVSDTLPLLLLLKSRPNPHLHQLPPPSPFHIPLFLSPILIP
jgi:hypothetical protein